MPAAVSHPGCEQERAANDHRDRSHKMSHTANAVDPARNSTAASLRIDASLAGYSERMR
jgi:hypothetical protein